MPVLHTQLRNRLEAAIKQARRTAEAAAKVALERLTVGSAEPGTHLSVDERQLRNRLRAHGRQLGDGRDPNTGTQSINRLIHECAYEHWHRMLFARFLAENHLLIHDKEGMPVTLAECDELARDEVESGASANEKQAGGLHHFDGWTLAARYAARMLPQIFRPDDPVLQVGFAPEHKRALEKLVTELPVEVFTADDSLGWVYQFWQAERKDEVNASGDKITGETLPAVTQLFTEHYMVLFLLHNTIGAWWAAKVKAEGKRQKAEWDSCQTEDDCRKLVALPGYEFAYLRFIREETPENSHKEAQNAQKGEKKECFASSAPFCGQPNPGSWRPAAGSFPGWPRSLKDFKMLDPCCGSGHFLVAAFVLLVLLRMRDENLSAKDACDAVLRENLHGLELDPRCTQIAAFALALTAWKFPNLHAPAAGADSTLAFSLQPSALGFRPLPPLNIACSGLGVNARKEDWLALANSDTRLRSGLEQLYDLFQKAPELGSLINPRRLAHGDLVTASFAEIQPLLTKALQSEKAKRDDDLNEIGVAAQGMAKAANLLAEQFTLVATNVPYLGCGKQNDVLRDYCERVHPNAKADLATCFLERCVAFCAHGGSDALVTPQSWWFSARSKGLRVSLLSTTTLRFLCTLGEEAWQTFGNRGPVTVLMAIDNCRAPEHHEVFGIDALPLATIPHKVAELQTGELVTLTQAGQHDNPDHRITIYKPIRGPLLEAFAICPRGIVAGDGERWFRQLWDFQVLQRTWRPLQGASSGHHPYSGRDQLIDWSLEGEGMLRPGRDNKAYGAKGVAVSRMRSLHVTLYTGELYEQSVAVIVPQDESHIPALWSYCSSSQFYEEIRKLDKKVNVTPATLLKVPFDLDHWQRVASEKYPRGLPEPASNDPTQWLFAGHPVDSMAPLQVSVARLLGYQWPRQTGQTVSGAPPVPGDDLEKFVDEDGIVCIPSVRGEAPAAERLRALLTTAYGKSWSPGKLDELLSAVGYAGSNLEDWLRNGFFDQHCKMFHQRPFIWQIWDGRKDGFSALVNYHKLDHKLLEKLTYTYLGDWIKKQQEAVGKEESGADDRLLKAQQLQDKLKLVLEGEAPYDIFVRWKPLEQQPIGWNPDINDGVRLNIRPFMEADVLRKRPNIKWGTDRGKNPPGSPWGEERDNDLHLTLEEKRKAHSK